MAGMAGKSGSRLKDKRIEIYKIVEYENALGSISQKLSSIGKFWAYYRQMNAKEVYEANKANIDEELFFEINWRDDLQAGAVWVKYKDKVFKVTRIDDYEGYKVNLRLYVTTDKGKQLN